MFYKHFLMTLMASTAIFNALSAVIVIPYNGDTTDRMNTGGDPADRPAWQGAQKNPEYKESWIYPREYYYGKGYPYQANPYYWNLYPDPTTHAYYRGPEDYNPAGVGYPYYYEYQRSPNGYMPYAPEYYQR